MTADASDDDLIKPEGLKNYVVPAPALMQPSVGLPDAEENTVTELDEAMTSLDDTTCNSHEWDEQEEPEDQSSLTMESQVLEDKYEDRDFRDDLVGRRVTAL